MAINRHRRQILREDQKLTGTYDGFWQRFGAGTRARLRDQVKSARTEAAANADLVSIQDVDAATHNGALGTRIPDDATAEEIESGVHSYIENQTETRANSFHGRITVREQQRGEAVTRRDRLNERVAEELGKKKFIALLFTKNGLSATQQLVLLLLVFGISVLEVVALYGAGTRWILQNFHTSSNWVIAPAMIGLVLVANGLMLWAAWMAGGLVAYLPVMRNHPWVRPAAQQIIGTIGVTLFAVAFQVVLFRIRSTAHSTAADSTGNELIALLVFTGVFVLALAEFSFAKPKLYDQKVLDEFEERHHDLVELDRSCHNLNQEAGKASRAFVRKLIGVLDSRYAPAGRTYLQQMPNLSAYTTPPVPWPEPSKPPELIAYEAATKPESSDPAPNSLVTSNGPGKTKAGV